MKLFKVFYSLKNGDPTFSTVSAESPDNAREYVIEAVRRQFGFTPKIKKVKVVKATPPKPEPENAPKIEA